MPKQFIRLGVNLEPEFYNQVKALADANGQTIKEAVEEALKKAIRRAGK